LKGGLESVKEIIERHGERIKKVIEEDMGRLAQENRFNSLEKVKGNFKLVSEEFEVGTILTPTMKLRRNEAKKYFKELIEELYRASAAE